MVKNYQIAILITLTIVFTLSASLFSEDNGLFNDNFAKSPITDSRKDVSERKPGFFEEESKTKNISVGPRANPTSEKPEEADRSENILDETSESKLLSVRSVSLILNCLNNKHSLDQANKLKEFVGKLGLTIYEVQCIGFDYANSKGDRNFEFVPFYGGMVTYNASPSAPYENIRKSPTLIVETEQGEYVLEAPDKSFDTYFSSAGKLIVSKLSQSSITPSDQTFSDFSGSFFE